MGKFKGFIKAVVFFAPALAIIGTGIAGLVFRVKEKKNYNSAINGMKQTEMFQTLIKDEEEAIKQSYINGEITLEQLNAANKHIKTDKYVEAVIRTEYNYENGEYLALLKSYDEYSRKSKALIDTFSVSAICLVPLLYYGNNIDNGIMRSLISKKEDKEEKKPIFEDIEKED